MTDLAASGNLHTSASVYGYDGNGDMTTAARADKESKATRYEYDLESLTHETRCWQIKFICGYAQAAGRPSRTLYRRCAADLSQNSELVQTPEFLAEANPTRSRPHCHRHATGDATCPFQNDQFLVGQWLNRDPIGERGGLNMYSFVLNKPVCHYDPFGLYRLQFDWFDGFTKDEKQKVAELIDSAGKRAQDISDECAKLIQMVMNDHNACCPGVLSQLMALKKLMDRIVAGVKSKSENLEVEKKNLDPETRGPATMVVYPIPLTDDVPVPFIDSVLQVSTNPKSPWKKKLDDEAMLHELSHIYGTENDDSEGELLNADIIGKFTWAGVQESSAFKGLLKQCPKSKKPMKPIPKM